VAAETEPDAPPRWTDVIIDGAGSEQRRACALAVASELRSITASPGNRGSVVRACAVDALPTLTSPQGPGVVLVESRAAGDELRAQTALAHAEPLTETLRARVATFILFPSPETCAEMLRRLQAKRSEIALRSHNEAIELAQLKVNAAAAERDNACANQNAIAAYCDVLPPPADLVRACKGGQGTRRCRVAHQQNRTRQSCVSGLRTAQRECERSMHDVDEARAHVPAGPPVQSGDQPVCIGLGP